MKKIAEILVAVVFVLNFSGFAAAKINIGFLKKKNKPRNEKMVETVDDWLNEAQNIPLDMREKRKYEIKKGNRHVHVPKPVYQFKRYNYPAGSRETNLSGIKKSLFVPSFLVADNDCKNAAYSHYYYSPDINQLSSEFFIEKLDTGKVKQRRLIEYDHGAIQRQPVISAGTKENYPNLFDSLTLVDWSKDGKKLLVKEKKGSMYEGIYKTYLYVCFYGNDNKSVVKLDKLDDAIKKYYLDMKNIQLEKYRYDISPLGFSSEDDDLVLALAYAVSNENQKIFLGTWSYNCATKEVKLVSKNSTSSPTSVNGLFLIQTLEKF